MRKTFTCNESMIITIPIRSLKDVQMGQLMPENFHCVFKDNFKVFVTKGKPKPVGAAQATAGVFIIALGLLCRGFLIFNLLSVLFVISGMLSYAAGTRPNIHLTKLSFSMNIISFFWSLAALCVFIIIIFPGPTEINGILGLIVSLLVVESMIALFLVYWLSKAICREHFNTLPTILLKETEANQ
ncbi:uncharacterized protein LOC121641944 isoform X2 [Melanotaenia boesemani]|uniref:uncharacterized protein LOC121641944 isoform X2 n=1 Tax=Melanotaenia boesemani TaxID=1250792 RepID=UPI001C05DAF0|nr:uncharacterized protein LOC121641944 isoform X2 [Melanotaenia boesemani]